jgi:hypothetical protein
MVIVKQNQHTVHCEVLTDIGENLEGRFGYNDTQILLGTMCNNNRLWTDSRSQQLIQ